MLMSAACCLRSLGFTFWGLALPRYHWYHWSEPCHVDIPDVRCRQSRQVWQSQDCWPAEHSQHTNITTRVRTILVLGYWVPGNIHRYWVVLLLGDTFCCSDTQYNTNQRAVGTVHIPVNDYLVLFVTCTLTATIVCLDTMLICCCLLNTIIVIIIEFGWGFFVVIAMLYTSIGIGIGYWYR